MLAELPPLITACSLLIINYNFPNLINGTDLKLQRHDVTHHSKKVVHLIKGKSYVFVFAIFMLLLWQCDY